MKKIILFIGILLTCLFQSIDAQTVYITDTGVKYHSENCRFLNKSKTAINLSDAKNKGYEACKICHPSQTITTTKKTETINSSTAKETQQSNSSSLQCSASTKAGNRCKRTTTSSNGKCWQHGGN
jgi:hypothetical protein